MYTYSTVVLVLCGILMSHILPVQANILLFSNPTLCHLPIRCFAVPPSNILHSFVSFFLLSNMLPPSCSIFWFTYIRSKDKRSNDKRSKDQRPKDKNKRSNDKRSKDKRSNWTQGRIGTQGRMTEGRMTEGRKGLKVERPNIDFERRKTEGRKSFLQFLKPYPKWIKQYWLGR